MAEDGRNLDETTGWFSLVSNDNTDESREDLPDRSVNDDLGEVFFYGTCIAGDFNDRLDRSAMK